MWIRGNVGRSGKRVSKRFRFMLIGPREDADADSLAERLIALKDVEEVFITEGDYGYLVKVRMGEETEGGKLESYIKKNVAEKFGTVTSHYSIKR